MNKLEGIFARVIISPKDENDIIIHGRETIRAIISSPENKFKAKILSIGTVLAFADKKYKITKIDVAFHEKTYPGLEDGYNEHAIDEQLDHGCDLLVSVVQIDAQ